MAYLDLLPGNEVRDLFCQLPEFFKIDVSIGELIGTTLIQEIQVFYKQTKEWNDDLERDDKKNLLITSYSPLITISTPALGRK